MFVKKRILYMDALRVIACLAVIFNHSGGFYLFGEQVPGGMMYRLDLIMSICCKFAVPVFFAISGAMLLNREIGLRALYTRRVFRMAVTLVVFSVGSYLVNVAQGRTAFSAKEMIFSLYDSDLNFSYWYLYAYLGFLMISPLLGAMLRSLDDRKILYMLALGMFFGFVLPAIETLRWQGAHALNPNFDMSFAACEAVLYPTMGYFVHHRLTTKKARQWLPLALLAAAVAVGLCAEATLREYYRTWVPKVEPYTALAMPFLGLAVMMGAKAIWGERLAESRLEGAISYAAALSFGAYLVHIPVLHSDAMVTAFGAFCEVSALPVMLEYLLQVLLTVLVSGAIAAVLRKIPGFRWMLG